MPAARRVALLAAAVLPFSALLPLTPAHAATGNEIVYSYDANNDGIYALVRKNLDTGAITELLPADPTQAYAYDDPEISPDGTMLLLSTDFKAAGQPGATEASGAPAMGMAVLNLDDGSFRRLTEPTSTATSSDVDTFGSWSPDGSTILFTRVTQNNDGTARGALFTVPAGGGNPTAVPNATNAFTADFNPTNGSQIVYAEAADVSAGVGTLTEISLDGTGKTALNATGALPAWSPDGSTIAFLTVTDNDTSPADADVTQIATISATPGSTPTVLAATRPTSARSVAEYPAWSPDGQSILYDVYGYNASGAAQPGDIWAVDKDGAHAAQLVNTPGDEAQVAISPSAAISPARAAAACNPRVTVDRSVLVSGQTANITVVGLATGTPVSLEGYSRPDTSYHVLRSATPAGSDGTVRFTVQPPTNTRFQVRGQDCATPGTSGVLTVASSLSINVYRLGTRSYRFTGRITPGPQNAGRVVGLYYVSGGRSVLRARATVSSSGTYSVDVRFSGSGQIPFTFKMGASSFNAAGTSPSRPVAIF
jgi:Tol biopolymer transport system component